MLVNGGVQQDEDSVCGNGASGTVYRKNEDSLVIDNNDIPVHAFTTAAIPLDRQHNSSKGISELAKKLTVRG